MKKLYINFLLLFLAGVFFTGCYTQVAVRDRDKDTGYYDDSYNNDSYDNEEEYYGDEYADYSDTTYYEDEVEINNYYIGGGPLYRRYFWGGYYPTFSIGFGYNNWYDPWCYDPWGWSSCIIGYPYSPFYNPYSYYGYGYYPYHGYYGGYYGSGWSWSGSRYRERDRDMVSIRNNTGLRNSYGNRGTLSRTNTRDLNKISGNDEVRRTRTSITSDRNRNTTDDRNRRETLNKTRRSGNNEVNRTRIEKRRDENPRITPPVKRNDTRREGVKENKRTERKEVRGQGNTGRRETIQKPRSSSPPQRTYNPPSTNSSPPRSSPPSRSSGNSSGRSSGSDRRTR